jgi:hypothetical protein
MPFGLTNALAIFQNFINDVLAPYLDQFCTAYLDDMLIYSDTFEEYQECINLVLEAFYNAGLHLKPEKCEFHCKEVKYLNLIISIEGIKIEPEKITAIQYGEAPYNLKDVHTFLGFANFYCRFVQNYSKIMQPLTLLTQKWVIFVWKEEQHKAFDDLKNMFMSVPVLAQFDPNWDVIVETDTSDYVSAIMALYPHVYDLQYYDTIPHEIMDHCGFEYHGLITHHSSSWLGDSISPTLYSLLQPLVCEVVTWFLTLVDDQGLEHNRIQLVIVMLLCIANPALQLIIRMYSHELISDKAWQLSNYGSSDIGEGLGFCVFHAAYSISVLGVQMKRLYK